MTRTITVHSIFLFLVSVVFVVQHTTCATMIPKTDTTQPSIELQIRGPGIGTKTMKNPPRERWTVADGTQFFNLQQGATYNFLLIVGDQGGAACAQLQFPDNFPVLRLE